jgi:hypothetical protein
MASRSPPSLKDAYKAPAARVLGLACAGAWGFVAFSLHHALFPNTPTALSSVIVSAALGLGPITLILFASLAAREASGARIAAEQVLALSEATHMTPSIDAVVQTRDLAAALREEVEALDSIVLVTARRLDAFENGLRADGGLIARALAEDVETMGRVRADLSAETAAIGDAVRTHVTQLRETSALMREETSVAVAALDSQVKVFGDVSAKIGQRSAEFAAAAADSVNGSAQFNAAIEKALDALAHATSLTDSARKSAEDAALVAQEAAGAVRGVTRSAIAEAREAAKQIRAEAGAFVSAAAAPVAAAFSLPRIISGGGRSANVTPPIPKPIAEIKAQVASAAAAKPKPAPAVTPTPIAPAPSNDDAPLSLADIVEASGLAITDILCADALDHIAQAAKRGPDARRAMVRAQAPDALRRISAHLRRDAHARREAEALRREPARALGGANESEARRRDLASAFLLIDTVLG